MRTQLSYLGPAGTHTEAAAMQHDDTATLHPQASIPDIYQSVVDGTANQGIVPIENSLQGSVTDTLDLLIQENALLIYRELIIKIEHSLIAKPGTDPKTINTIYSHPQALGQCKLFLNNHFPDALQVASLSTASAVEEVLKPHSTNSAAIANKRAALIYKANVLSNNIQDSQGNATRFVILAREDHKPTGEDKTSLCISFEGDRPGLLYYSLGEFANRNINLSKIESRPNRETLGRYVFLIDLEGHRTQTHVLAALQALRKHTASIKILGSYPQAHI
jgi:prephenate dehydratase